MTPKGRGSATSGTERARKDCVMYVVTIPFIFRPSFFLKLSDKYDRERLALSTSTTTLRNKERDSAPHLATGTGRAAAGQTTGGTRRTEAREPAKKKPGEASDDWRRGGAEPTKGGRDDRTSSIRFIRFRHLTSL